MIQKPNRQIHVSSSTKTTIKNDNLAYLVGFEALTQYYIFYLYFGKIIITSKSAYKII